MSKPAHLHRWMIPIAWSFPILAIAFAFSLGPSPEKRLLTFQASSDSAEVAFEILDEAGAEMIPLLGRAIADREMPRRADAIRYLRQRGPAAQDAAASLKRLASSDLETDADRALVLEALLRIDPAMAETVARTYRHRPDPFGNAARAILHPGGGAPVADAQP